MTLIDIQTRLGDLRVEALLRGGEPLLDHVEVLLGVAQRHADRVDSGRLTLTPAVLHEVHQSFDRAVRAIQSHEAQLP